MPRLLFTKTGDAVWMSHLDLMRLMQRAFRRAGLPLKHTQGFNPRPSVSIALPLSVGMESVCELLDFDLDGETISCDEIVKRLNDALIPGVQVRECYDCGRKIKDLAMLFCAVTLEYDRGVTDAKLDQIEQVFRRDSLLLEKKGKNGPTQQDIIPMIRRISVTRESEQTVRLDALICCQNPSLNPMQLAAAVSTCLPECKPDHALCRRLEIYDAKETIFR